MRQPGDPGESGEIGGVEPETGTRERRSRERRRPRRGDRQKTGPGPAAGGPSPTKPARPSGQEGEVPAQPRREPADERSLASLLKELRDEGTRLLRQEVALAKAEIGEKIDVYRRGLITLGIGVALMLAALLPLVETMVRGLTVLLEDALALETAVWLAPLIIAVVLGAVGYAVLRAGTHTVSEEDVVPHRTVDSLQEDKRWVEQKGREVKRRVEHG